MEKRKKEIMERLYAINEEVDRLHKINQSMSSNDYEDIMKNVDKMMDLAREADKLDTEYKAILLYEAKQKSESIFTKFKKFIEKEICFYK